MTATTELPATIGTTHDAPSARDIEDLVREHMPMVGHLVRELLNRVPGHVHADDLSSAGFAALLGAARSFDVTRGIPVPPLRRGPHPRRPAGRAPRAGLGQPLGAGPGAAHGRGPPGADRGPGAYAHRRRGGRAARHRRGRTGHRRGRRAEGGAAEPAGLPDGRGRGDGAGAVRGTRGPAAQAGTTRLPAPGHPGAAGTAAAGGDRVASCRSSRSATWRPGSASPSRGSPSCAPRRCGCCARA